MSFLAVVSGLGVQSGSRYPLLCKSETGGRKHKSTWEKLKGTVQPEWIYMRVVLLDRPCKRHNRYRFLIFLFYS
jgi:hypothetical protein